MIIAIDGPAAAGKGTLARRLADVFDLAYLDTGALYRATALAVTKSGGDPKDQSLAANVSANLDLELMNDPDLRSESTGGVASIVSAYPEVRANLLAFQQNFAATPPNGKKGAILDGRDIGTVVCPDADLKLFVTASAEERAMRRLKEMQDRGLKADFDTILNDVKARDERDMGRKDAPLKPAEDACLLDTTKLSIEAAFEQAAERVEAVLNQK